VSEFAKMSVSFFHTPSVALCICRNSVYMVPPCELILHMLPETVWRSDDPVTIADLIFVTLGPTVRIVTQWSGSGGIEAYLSGQLASFSALMLLVGSSDL